MTSPPVGRGPALVLARALGIALAEQPDLGDGVIDGEATNDASLYRDGVVRAGALISFTDTAAGLAGALCVWPDAWCVTTNIRVRVGDRSPTGPLHLRTSLVRKGTAAVITDATVLDERDTFVAHAIVTSAILVPEHGPPVTERPWSMRADGATPIDETLDLTERAGGIHLHLHDGIRNPWGILHGGVTGYLVEAAARTAAPGHPADTALHYLAPGRIGPIHARATAVGDRPDGTIVRVEVRDEGADRTMAVATTLCR